MGEKKKNSQNKNGNVWVVWGSRFVTHWERAGYMLPHTKRVWGWCGEDLAGVGKVWGSVRGKVGGGAFFSDWRKFFPPIFHRA